MGSARTAQPHLIILDVRLPDGSGFDVRQMRQAGVHRPILILTVQNEEEIDKVLGLEMGADDYLTKPYGLHSTLRGYAPCCTARRRFTHWDSLPARQQPHG